MVVNIIRFYAAHEAFPQHQIMPHKHKIGCLLETLSKVLVNANWTRNHKSKSLISNSVEGSL